MIAKKIILNLELLQQLSENKAIIDATAQYTVAYKPNLAFYEVLGWEGVKAFEETVKYIQENHPDIFIIADAKRGDIGNTSKMYAKSMFEYTNVDAITGATVSTKGITAGVNAALSVAGVLG